MLLALMSPAFYLMMIYIGAAVIPALFLMWWVYRNDRIEPEPPDLLWRLFRGGLISVPIAFVLESLLSMIFNSIYPNPDEPMYHILYAFLVVAIVEEGCKYFFLRRISWQHPAFNYRFDGIVYAVFVSLGFAALENIGYVFSYGISVAAPRACLSIPGHLAFSVAMGVFYGQAKLCSDIGARGFARFCSVMAYVSAVFLHGFYDACAMIGSNRSSIVLVLFVIFLYIFIFTTIRWQSRHDVPA